MSARVRSRWTMTALTAVTAAGALIACGTGSTAKAATSGAGTVRASVQEDFNGDGYADLVVGAPRGTVGGLTDAGYVTVMYGSAHGLSASHRTVISRATQGIPGDPQEGLGFGYAVSKGDLDEDGYADLVISSLGEDSSVIVWGGKGGLSGGTAIPHYRSLSRTGDFNGDSHTDLALFQTTHTGHDDPSGTDTVVWYGPVSRAGKPASTSTFGASSTRLDEVQSAASGDVNGDGYADLALADYTGEGGTGTELYYGSASGLRTTSDRDIPYADTATLGDVNHDGYDDFIAGDATNAYVIVGYGSAAGLPTGSAWTRITRSTAGVPGKRSDDGFGTSLSVGDVNGDGIDDVAVGAPGSQVDGKADAGDVVLLRGSKSGLTGRNAQSFSQNTSGVPGTAEANDQFGSQVQLLDINGNGRADLAAAALRENSWNGAVWVLRGTKTGLTSDAAFAFGGKTIRAPYAKAWFGFTLG
ncbi:VCBS repeat-containing protein [Streptomyces sp. NPDC059373]